ncbi:MAG: AAA family ATPase, partial [Chloroflexota bacterium]
MAITPYRRNNAPQKRKETPSMDEQGRRLTLTPTGLAQYLSLDSCDRFLRFYLYKGETDKMARRLKEQGLKKLALQPFGPLMAKLGDRVETKVLEGLQAQGYTVQNLTNQGLEATQAAIQAVGNEPVYLYQAEVAGPLGKWQFGGKADLIRIRRPKPDTCVQKHPLEILVGDVKSTRQDKVHHRLQVAIYVRMLQGMLAEQTGFTAEGFSGTVVRRNPDGTLQDPETAALFDLDPYFAAINQLAIAKDSALARVDSTPFEDLHYYLNQKCDGCLFNPVCMVESAERQDVALVPFLESADKRVLVEHGIRTVSDLAHLKVLPQPTNQTPDSAPVSTNRHLTPAPGREALVAKLSEKWPVGPKLDRLVQRAARVLHRLAPEEKVTSYSYFFDAERGSLPDDQKYPDLVKIFLDVQTDYLEDRVYLAGARVVGPQGSESVILMTPGVPQEETERALLVEWVANIFVAVTKVATDPTATPIHLYLYNQHDQKFLLDALRRHLEVFASLPTLYDLLTETPALTQSAVSFLYDEIKERRNLSGSGHTLQAVATQSGFKWNDGEELLYYRLFEQGMFDYLWRREDGNLVESAARFYSTIPLEYAYAAWGMFQAEDFLPNQRIFVAPYLKVTTDQIERFQAKRLEALAYLEAGFKYKNSYLNKEPINLLQLSTQTTTPPPFRRVLEEFLYIEHYANLQEHLQLFSQPIVKRVQMGRALLVRCIKIEVENYKGKPATVAHFEVDFSGTGLEPAAAMQLNKIKSGDFVVLNQLEADGHPWNIVRGRLSIIRNLEGTRLIVSLTNMTFFGGKGRTLPFRYTHDKNLQPEIGDFYTIDEMVDDLNGDKLLEGCRNAEFNPFYHLMARGVEAESAPLVRPASDNAKKFMTLVKALEGNNSPTVNQQVVIIGGLSRLPQSESLPQGEKLFLVQGPPGTGKSHTLGWAVLARLFFSQQAGPAPFRVAVSCQTHNAVNIVLQSIARKLAQLKGRVNWPWLEKVRLFKVGEEDDLNTSAGVEQLEPWEQRRNLAQLLGNGLVIIGATPGGLYKLMKEKTRNSHAEDALWNDKPFDLVILDEASQMNLPQAILASAWLQEEGELIVVGDHRQMAPILAHGWETEDRRTTAATQPYRSVFQYLIDQNFPRVALDESFRLHRVQAEFLHENIYRHDGIQFHSRRQQLLPACSDAANLSPYLQAVLNPDYPVIVIQHTESGSQQANPTEAGLIAPIIEICAGQLGLDGAEGIGVVVPHRAQKALL